MRFQDTQGYFDPEGTKYPYCDNDKAKDIVKAGYRLSRRQTDCPSVYPSGYYWIYRRFDGKLIGRAEREEYPDNTSESKLPGWKSRYFFFGGGSTHGTFRTLRAAATDVLKRNASLSEGWDL